MNSVLIVDDEAMNITALMHILNRDYKVYAERDGANCLRTVKNLKPDLILLDVMMPEVDGFEVIRRLKGDEETKDIPVIFVTAKVGSDDEVQGFSLGAVDYIYKPYNPPVIEMRVRHQINLLNFTRREREVMEAQKLMFESIPLPFNLWTADYKVIDCNRAMVDFLQAPNKETALAHFYDFSVETQPCGTPSAEKIMHIIDEVLDTKKIIRHRWNHLVGGTIIPVEVSATLVQMRGQFFCACYAVDLRPIEAALEAEENNLAKSRFLARMSHEIRTPITAVMGITEIQLRNRIVPYQTEEALVQIYSSSKTLLNIVNDILDFSKIESGNMPIINTEYDVASLVGDAAQLHLIYSERKNVSFVMDIDPNLPVKLVGDNLRIRQIINNLLTNAFKYTESGEILFSLSFEDGLVIKISDTGFGMTTQQIEEIGSEYVRFHEQDKPFVGGTGLGLPIVYSLAKMMNAKIELKSKPGVGTCASVRVPQRASGTDVIGPELASSLKNFESQQWFVTKELEFEPEAMPYGKVLVVDDVDTNLYVAEAMLESFGLSVELCERGQEAIDKITQGNEYDVIFMDHMMPGMDGIETTNALRRMGYTLPIVALTANAVKGQAEMFLNNGFSGFMSKPIDINLLSSYLVRFVKNKHEA
ncbi:MAG: response regulator [Defluviitaleaceae bacterium]|nr:response regulator [Defluviitaleaceae bacterium]